MITACEAITVAAVARIAIGSSQPLGTSRKNGGIHHALLAQQQRALTEVVEHQRRQDQAEPAPT